MKRYTYPILILGLLLLLAACRTQPDPTPTPEAPAVTAVDSTPTPQPSPEPTNEPTPEPTPEPVTSDQPPATSERFPPAPIVNDEGGPVSITGVVTYTNPFFTLGVAAPVVILEDQAGFVDRDQFFLMPIESQTLGQITSDFFESPFSYSLALPIEPQGTFRDVDNNGEADSGVQIFAIAYWTNTFGDPFLEERDLYGGGWSTAYASTRVSEEAATEREIVGGRFLVYAPDDQQGFPGGFGSDGLLFTEDDPIVQLPQGYTVVDMDSDPFTFDRARQQVIDLIEPSGAALVDYSELSYLDAFNALIDQLKNEYAFTEYKGIDWEALRGELSDDFADATRRRDAALYRQALRDLAWAIPDGHVSGPFLQNEFALANANGIGLVVKETSDGRFLVTWLLSEGPAEGAGIELGAELLSLNGLPMADVVDNTIGWLGPYSTDHNRRLSQTVFATRFPLQSRDVTVSWENPGDGVETAVLPIEFEQESLFAALQEVIPTGFELPLDYELLPDSNIVVARIYSFSDNALLTVQLWERLMRQLNESGADGLIIDMRLNGGGSGFLADQMAAYLFDEPLTLGSVGSYDKDRGEFYFDPRGVNRFYLPDESLRFLGPVAVIVGPNCASACEFFSYDLTLNGRAAIVGHYPTAGLGGSIKQVLMPEEEYFTFTAGRAVDNDGNIHIEGIGIVPTLLVPVTEESLLGGRDVLLETAVGALR